MNSQNIVEAGGVQGANFAGCTVNNSTINIGKSDQSIDIVKILSEYKSWVVAKKTNSQISRKLNQLVINGKRCHIRRTLSRNGEQFSADELVNKIPLSETSLVTGPAVLFIIDGIGKNIKSFFNKIDIWFCF